LHRSAISSVAVENKDAEGNVAILLAKLPTWLPFLALRKSNEGMRKAVVILIGYNTSDSVRFYDEPNLFF